MMWRVLVRVVWTAFARGREAPGACGAVLFYGLSMPTLSTVALVTDEAGAMKIVMLLV